MVFTDNMQIIELDSFDTAFPVPPGGEDDAKRRFMTLFAAADSQARAGGTSVVYPVQSFSGERFALKRLLSSDILPKGVVAGTPESARLTAGRAAAFHQEYQNQLLVSRLRGFPRLYGYGTIGDDPVIIMEWVEGTTLREFSRMAAQRHGQVPADAIIAIGRAVATALVDASRLDATLVHRDISPTNIIIRTRNATLQEQADRGAFDICLIDFGASAVADPLLEPDDPSFTMSMQAWRYGTPEYAAPEMLTRDLPRIDELRKSPTIDVFALCSILYELYAGKTPWQVAEHPEISPYLLKTTQPPSPLAPRSPEDRPLIDAIVGGLAIEQGERPSIHAIARQLDGLAVARGIATPEREGTTAGNTVPSEGVHLAVAPVDRGGRRANDEPAAFMQRKRGITRRSFAVGALVVAVGAIAGGGLAWRYHSSQTPDFSGYPLAMRAASQPLYPARHLANSSWVLRDAESASEIALESLGREPGKPIAGIFRAYDSSHARTGFMTIANSGGSSQAAWLLLPRYADADDFSDPDADGIQLAAAKETANGLWGYLATDGTWRIDPRFRRAGRFGNGYAAVQPDGQMLWGLADQTGATVFGPRFEQLGTCADNGLIAAREPGNAAFGFIDVNGNWAIAPSLRQVRRFTEGLAACMVGDDARWGYLDAGGNVSIEARFANAYPFADGRAPAQDISTGLWGLIDTTGSWHVKPQFLAIGEKLGDLFPAHGSPAYVYDIDAADRDAWEEYLEGATDEVFGYGYIDAAGRWVINPTYGDTLIRAPRR
ncbi:MAG: WG repeat-containing protein [Coriobacteriaceae bacterium]|nr:WG repeat-containing protein [Coriobacteriaceae bacterium]